MKALVEQMTTNSVPAYKVLMRKHCLFMRLLSTSIINALTIKMDSRSQVKKILRQFPMVPGIDFSGVVHHTKILAHIGQHVLLTGWGVVKTTGVVLQKSRW